MEQPVASWKNGKCSKTPPIWWAFDYLTAALCLAAIAPFFQSMLTWDSDGELTPSAFIIRHLSLPTVVIEIFIIYVASRSGFNFRRSFDDLGQALKVTVIIWALFAVLASIIFSSNVAYSLFFVIRYSMHGTVLLSLLYLFSQSKNHDLSRWLAIMTSGALLYLLSLSVFVFLTRNEVNFPWALRLPSATNIRQIGNLLSILAVAPVAALLANDHRHKVLYLIAVTLIVAFVTWTGTRGGMLGLALGSVVGVIMAYKFTSLRNIAVFMSSWGAGVLISIPFFKPAADFGLFRMVKTVTSDQHISPGRAEMWTDTLSEVLKFPFLGFGSGNYRENMFEKYQYDFNHPHNVVLQCLYDWGFIGGTAALLMLIWLGVRLFTMDNRRTTLCFLSIAAFCTTLAIAMIEGALFHPLPILIAIAMIAPALGVKPDPLQAD